MDGKAPWILANFQGYLQTDGYVAYDIFDKRPNITLIYCMAHARRMFNEALDNDYERASYALKEIQKLYNIERVCREGNANFEEIRIVRCAKAAPILKGMWLWMQQQYI